MGVPSLFRSRAFCFVLCTAFLIVLIELGIDAWQAVPVETGNRVSYAQFQTMVATADEAGDFAAAQLLRLGGLPRNARLVEALPQREQMSLGTSAPPLPIRTYAYVFTWRPDVVAPSDYVIIIEVSPQIRRRCVSPNAPLSPTADALTPPICSEYSTEYDLTLSYVYRRWAPDWWINLTMHPVVKVPKPSAVRWECGGKDGHLDVALQVLARPVGVTKGFPHSDTEVLHEIKRGGVSIDFDADAPYQPFGASPPNSRQNRFQPRRIIITDRIWDNGGGRWFYALLQPPGSRERSWRLIASDVTESVCDATLPVVTRQRTRSQSDLVADALTLAGDEQRYRTRSIVPRKGHLVSIQTTKEDITIDVETSRPGDGRWRASFRYNRVANQLRGARFTRIH